jgi:hypothetical protein
VRDLHRKYLERIIGAKADTPAAANNLLKKIRALLNYAVATGDYRNDNPANGIERFREGTHQHLDRSGDCEAFYISWPVALFAVALGLLMFSWFGAVMRLKKRSARQRQMRRAL